MFFFLLCHDNLAFFSLEDRCSLLPSWPRKEYQGYSPLKKKKNRVEKRTIRNRRRKKFSFFLFFLFGSREGRGDSRDRGALCYLGVALMRASVFFFLPLKRIFRPVWTGWNLPSPREIKRGHLPDRRKITYVCPRRTITWTSPITRMPSLRNNNCIPSENTRYEPFLLLSFFFSFFFHIHLSLSFSILSTRLHLHEYLNVFRAIEIGE